MALEEELRNVARDIADRLRLRLPELEGEHAQIETRKTQIEARFLNYRPHIGPDFQCPHCWVHNEQRSVLRPVHTNTDDDLFRCGACQLELMF